VLGISSLIAIPRAFYISALRGLQKMEFNNLIDVGASALQQFGTILVLLRGGGLPEVAGWFAACFVSSLLAYILVVSHFFSPAASVPRLSIEVMRRNFRYTSRMASSSLLAMVHTQSDKVIISKLLPLASFGYYTLAYGAVSKGAVMTTSIAQAALPSLSDLFKSGTREALMTQYRKLQDLISFLTVPIFAGIFFAELPVFTYVLNAEVARMLLWPIAFLCVGFCMNASLNAPFVFSLAVGRPDIAARLNFYGLFVVLPVTGLLVYRFGLAGAGFSWIFYHVFALPYQVSRTCSECLHIPAWRWYVDFLKVVLLTILTYGIGWGVIVSAGRQSLTFLASTYVVSSILFLAVAYGSIGDELRDTFKQFFVERSASGT
jgi:O-antigen/teichoic acid export membrane protein